MPAWKNHPGVRPLSELATRVIVKSCEVDLENYREALTLVPALMRHKVAEVIVEVRLTKKTKGLPFRKN